MKLTAKYLTKCMLLSVVNAFAFKLMGIMTGDDLRIYWN
jgi:hypothetical protein